MSGTAEAVGNQAAAVVGDAVAAAEIAVETAEARAAAAEAAAAAIAASVVERAIVERVDDCEEGLSECHGQIESLRAETQSLLSLMTAIQSRLATLETPPEAPPLILVPAPSSEIPMPQPEAPEAPPIVAAAVPESVPVAVALPVAATKPNRFRVT